MSAVGRGFDTVGDGHCRVEKRQKVVVDAAIGVASIVIADLVAVVAAAVVVFAVAVEVLIIASVAVIWFLNHECLLSTAAGHFLASHLGLLLGWAYLL